MSDISPINRRAEMVQAMPLDDLASAYSDVTAQLADVKNMLEHINAEFLRRASEKNASVLFTDDAEIEITYTEKIQHRFDVLRQLEGKIPDELFSKAVYLKQVDPTWTADTIKLKSIANKYGSEVAEIVAKGMPRERVGNPKITVKPRDIPQNVTDSKAA